MTPDISTRKYKMFGSSVDMTLDELVKNVVPELTTGTKRRKMSRYQAIFHAMTRIHAGLGPLMGREGYYVVCMAAQRAADLNDALIGDDE